VNEGDLVAGRYRLVRPIGRGAMGTVWSARHELLGRDFALKFATVPARSAPETRERFLREAQMVGKLRHPNVVDVADFGEVSPGTGLYLAMELLEGESLAERIERHEKLEPAEVLAIGAEIARGLAAAHAASIVHHDIKPENIFLSRGPAGGVVPKLLDFGISKHLEDDARGEPSAHPIGTPAYMSPEQALGQLDVDRRTDIWSLGVVLHEMLSGKHPFVAPNYQALMTRIAEEPFAPLDASVPGPVRAIVARCLEKDPARRFQSATELGVALERALDSLGGAGTRELVIERTRALPSLRPSTAPKAPSSATQRRAALAALALGLVVALGLLARMNRKEPATLPAVPPEPSAAPPASATRTAELPPPAASSIPVPAAASAQAPAPSARTVAPTGTNAASTPRPSPSPGKGRSTSVNDPGF
jgi:serine/threonine-protein kinase